MSMVSLECQVMEMVSPAVSPHVYTVTSLCQNSSLVT